MKEYVALKKTDVHLLLDNWCSFFDFIKDVIKLKTLSPN